MWGRMDDTFADHPKVEELSLDAIGLWTVCWSRALKALRSPDVHVGFVSETFVKKRAGSKFRRLVAELTRPAPGYKHGMWEPVEGGFLIHDFQEYLPKRRDPVEASEAGKKGAHNRWAKTKRVETATQNDANSHSSSHANSQGNSHSSAIADDMAPDGTRASAPAFPYPYPSRTQEELTLGEHRSVTSPPPTATQHPPDDDPTEARCTAHTSVATPPPCLGCKNARERAEAATNRDRDQAEREHRIAAEAAARACNRCDGTWEIDPTTTLPTRRRCDHRRTA